MHILELIKEDGVKLIRQGMTYRGRCPFHEGKTKTSLLVDAEAGKYHCFGCDQHGDSIDWLRMKRGLSYGEACKVLGYDPVQRSNNTPLISRPAWIPQETKVPSPLWQKHAGLFFETFQESLWSEQGKAAREWLHNIKGLDSDSILTAGLGLNTVDRYRSRSEWGLPKELNENGRPRKIKIPAGLVIPHIVNGSVQRFRVRMQKPHEGLKYKVVSGSSMMPMIFSLERAAVIIVESELDAILLSQETGDIVTVIATGSASLKPDTVAHKLLTQATVILIALDSDDAGRKSSTWWLEQYPQAKRWPTVHGKDPSEARLNGLDLRSWIIAGIFQNELSYERFCIQTISGNISDAEALQAIA